MDTIEKNLKKFLFSIQTEKNTEHIENGIINHETTNRKNLLDLNILIGLDVSSSITDKQFSEFMTYVEKIKGLSRIKVFEIDNKIVSFYNYFNQSENPIARDSKSGTTALAQGIKLAERIKPDALVMLTDGDTTDYIESSNIKTAWILTHDGLPPYPFGTTLGLMES